jgi:hypothetical protein
VTPEDFDELAAPMRRDAQPVFERFLASNGLLATTGLGRYPRVRGHVERSDGSSVWIEFGMGVDATGHYFTRFDDRLPHELAAGVWLDRVESEQRVRYTRLSVRYDARPYLDALATLAGDLQELWEIVREWGAADALEGRRTVLPR